MCDETSEDVCIYAILHIREPPRLLISKSDSKHFHCYFALPLPPQIVVFRLGKPTCLRYNSRISVEVSLDNETPPFTVGYLQNNVHSGCFQPTWSNDFLARSYVLHEKDSMAKLLLTVLDENNKIGQEKLKQIERSKIVIKLTKEPFPIKISSMSPERPLKKIKKHVKRTTLKRKKDSRQDHNNNNRHFLPTTLAIAVVKMSAKCITDLTPAPSPGTPMRHGDLLKSAEKKEHAKPNIPCPSSRWGLTACSTSDNQVIILGGQGENYLMVKDSLCVLDCATKTWETDLCRNVITNRRMGHTSTFDSCKNVIYVYGGFKSKLWFKDVDILDLQTWQWANIKGIGSAPKRAYHSSVLYQGEVLIFGGSYPNPQQDGCSNELYIFNPEKSTWYQPEVTGELPPARSGHSFELYEESKAVIFGGWDTPLCYNDVFCLNLGIMEFTKLDVVGVKPTCRTWHSSVLLADKRLLIHGGFDGANNKVLGDSFIFDIEKLTWIEVDTSPKIQPLVGHVMFCQKETNEEEEQVMVFGGGDNHGNFFKDLVCIDAFSEKL